MILTIKELKATIASDKERMGFGKKQRSILKEWLKGNIDDVRLMLLIIYLRKYEYVVNKYKGKGLLGNFLYLYYKHKYYWKCKSRNIFISPNCIEGGYILYIQDIDGLMNQQKSEVIVPFYQEYY